MVYSSDSGDITASDIINVLNSWAAINGPVLMYYCRLVETWQPLVKCAALHVKVQPLYMGPVWEGLLLFGG